MPGNLQSISAGPAPGQGGALPLRAILPGLIYIVCLDAATVAGWMPRLGKLFIGSPLVLAVLPWATLAVLRLSPSVLGYTRRRAFLEYGWGMLAGAIWRGLSMAFNAWWLSGQSQIGWEWGGLLGGLIWVPLVEETFFRGYLGLALAEKTGRWIGILIQALLFTLHPVHWAQGWLGLVSVFAFGLLAGWLTQFRKTIWAAWGAHGFANILPGILRAIVSP